MRAHRLSPTQSTSVGFIEVRADADDRERDSDDAAAADEITNNAYDGNVLISRPRTMDGLPGDASRPKMKKLLAGGKLGKNVRRTVPTKLDKSNQDLSDVYTMSLQTVPGEDASEEDRD